MLFLSCKVLLLLSISLLVAQIFSEDIARYMHDLDLMADSSNKTEAQSSSMEVNKTRASFDGVEDADDVYSRANPSRPGFTRSDQKDMWRMGKLQELKVRLSSHVYSSTMMKIINVDARDPIVHCPRSASPSF